MNRVFNISKSTIKLRFKLGNLVFAGVVSKVPTLEAYGIANETEDGYYVPFFDCDNVYRDVVVETARRLQRGFEVDGKKIRLGDLYLFSTEEKEIGGRLAGRYYLVGLDKLRFWDFAELLKFVPVVDRNYVRVPYYFKNRYWVLRFSPKVENGKSIKERPKFVRALLCRRDSGYEKSRAHYKFLKAYGVPVRKPRKLDSGRKLKIIRYKTTRGGWFVMDSVKKMFFGG